MERTKGEPARERPDAEEQPMATEEAVLFLAAYERARRNPSPIRGRITPNVRAAQWARRAFVETISRALSADL